jgi:hypothetical protein
MDNLCENLLETYNTNYLANASQSERDMFEKASEDFYGSGKGNQTLMKLILNRHRRMKPVTDYISGPLSLTLQTHKRMKMSIYNFGEAHGITNDCDKKGVEIQKYLEDLLTNTDVFIDLFIELRPIANKKYRDMFGTGPGFTEENKYLYKMHNTFAPCILREKKIKCSLSRVHWIDDRELDYSDSIITLYTIWFCRKYSSNDERLSDINTKFSSMLNTFANGSEQMFQMFFVNEMRDFSQKSKEFNRSYMSKEILAFSTKKIMVNASNARKHIVTSARNVLKYPNDRKHTESLCRSLTGVVSVFADLYTLSRMFKDFKDEGNRPRRPRNIIFYGGNYHANMYREFLKSIDFIDVDEEFEPLVTTDDGKRDYNRCLDVSHFQQPFFDSLPL